jgi:hypothetical protein
VEPYPVKKKKKKTIVSFAVCMAEGGVSLLYHYTIVISIVKAQLLDMYSGIGASGFRRPYTS